MNYASIKLSSGPLLRMIDTAQTSESVLLISKRHTY